MANKGKDKIQTGSRWFKKSQKRITPKEPSGKDGYSYTVGCTSCGKNAYEPTESPVSGRQRTTRCKKCGKTIIIYHRGKY